MVLELETLPHSVGKALQAGEVTGQPVEKRGISLGRIVDELIANHHQAGQFPSHISLQQVYGSRFGAKSMNREL